MDFKFTEVDLAVLTKWDTPTICNALELVCPERRGYGFTTKHLFSLDSNLPPVCGLARTATIRAASASTESDAAMAKKRSAYYEYVAKAPGPKLRLFRTLTLSRALVRFGARCKRIFIRVLALLGR